MTKYIPHEPEPPQQVFLLLTDRELFYGGAAGGGKSDALLMAALQYVDLPGYDGLLLRRTFTELNLPGGLVPRSKEWLSGTDAEWVGDTHTWYFPSGATISFRHIQHEDDVYQFGGSEYNYIGFDELTRFTEFQYRFLFSRLRRARGSAIPSRVRSASNPGGLGHDWVKRRFVGDEKSTPPVPPEVPDAFIPARLKDNPHVDRADYEASLDVLHPIIKARLLAGDWSAGAIGEFFERSWFPVVPAAPVQFQRMIRFWDLAASEPTADVPDPDWTAGLKAGIDYNGSIWGLDMAHFRKRTAERDRIIKQQAVIDGRDCHIYIEQEPGAAGKAQIEYFRRLLVGFVVQGVASGKDKATRAGIVASQAKAGNIVLLNGPWVGGYLEELEAFSGEGTHAHDDRVDATSGAVVALSVNVGSEVYAY